MGRANEMNVHTFTIHEEEIYSADQSILESPIKTRVRLSSAPLDASPSPRPSQLLLRALLHESEDESPSL